MQPPTRGSRCPSSPSWDQCLPFCPLGRLLSAFLSPTSQSPGWCPSRLGPGSPCAEGADGWVNSWASVSHLGESGASSLGPACLGPATPTGFQDCHLSGVYREGSRASRPGVKDSMALNHITGWKGEVTSPWEHGHSGPAQQGADSVPGASGCGFLQEARRGVDKEAVPLSSYHGP